MSCLKRFNFITFGHNIWASSYGWFQVGSFEEICLSKIQIDLNLDIMQDVGTEKGDC